MELTDFCPWCAAEAFDYLPLVHKDVPHDEAAFWTEAEWEARADAAFDALQDRG